jgi:eukaryotic-like serine/threonine-protein kinase
MARIAPGEKIAGKYHLARPLAEGGMGAVWVARHVDLDIEVAVKFITAVGVGEGPQSPAARFRREARAAARLKSPNVTQIHDYGVDDGVPYMVMELLAGEDLDSRLKRVGRMSPTEAAGIVDQLCRGLQIAHDAGVVHRDLKPSNVFLARVGDEEIPKILDFGIAKIVTHDGNSTQTVGAVIGTPLYMSPEQSQAKPLDVRSDIWSLGVMAFRMVTGALPFRGEMIWEIVAAICTQPVPSVGEHDAGLPPTLDRFFARALARPLDQRIASARTFARAFRAAGEGRAAELEEMLAAPDSHAATVPATPFALAETMPTPIPLQQSTTAQMGAALVTPSPPPRTSRTVLVALAGTALVAAIAWYAGRHSGGDGTAKIPSAAGSAAESANGWPSPVSPASANATGPSATAAASGAAPNASGSAASTPNRVVVPVRPAPSARPSARPSKHNEFGI